MKKKAYPKTPSEAEKMVRKAAREGKVKMAPHEEVDQYDWKAFTKSVYGKEALFVSDWTKLTDFDKPKRAVIRIFEIYGIKVDHDALLTEVLSQIDLVA